MFIFVVCSVFGLFTWILCLVKGCCFLCLFWFYVIYFVERRL